VTGGLEDKQLALEVTRFVQQMPAVRTQHQEFVESERKRLERKATKQVVQEQGRVVPGTEKTR
jgi:hypothetical protein